MKQFQITTFVIISIIGFSCTKEIEFNGKLLEPKLVVNAICALDSTFSVEVSESKTIPGFESPYRILSDATVKLYVDGMEFEKLVYDTSGLSYQGSFSVSQSAIYNGNTIVESGKNYKIEVSHPDYNATATGEMKIGEKVPILDISTDSIPYLDNLSRNRQRIKVTLKFSDQADEANFYRLLINYRMGKNQWYQNAEGDTIKLVQVMDYIYLNSTIASDDPVFSTNESTDEMMLGSTNQSGLTIFSDALLNGKTYDLTFYLNENLFYDFQENGMDTTRGDFYLVTIELQSLTNDTYYYIKSSGSFNWISDGFLTEPVQVYSNIANGLGIFGACSSSISTMQKGEYPIEGISYYYGSVSY
jgi:hypothetical protein